MKDAKDGKVAERTVEDALVTAVKAAGGVAYKMNSASMTGLPDRIVLLPPGKCAFVELKATGERMRPAQERRAVSLYALGFPVLCIDSPRDAVKAVEAIRGWEPGTEPPTGVGVRIPSIIPGGWRP